MTEQVTIEAEFLRHLMDARDASERMEFTIAEATRERDREHQRAEKFLRSLMAARKELRKRPDSAAIETARKQRDDAVLAADRIRKDCDGLAEKANAAKSEIFRLRQELTETQRARDEAVERAERAEAVWRDLAVERMAMIERANVANERAALLATTNNSLARERDMAFTVAEKAEKARDTARAEVARLTDELAVTRNAGESWKARCEKAEAEIESLRARIDPVTLAEAIVGSLFTSVQGIATRLELKQGGIADGSERHLGGWIRRPAVNRVISIICDHMKREGKP